MGGGWKVYVLNDWLSLGDNVSWERRIEDSGEGLGLMLWQIMNTNKNMYI